ncbi:GNAT family N-acetyltransferase [Microbulbifer aggregans]|uniref:GNAT family N-acetyltransferase n=1 Tax=Microbulbifer aggregans TaxID=1769779 RepID=UPI001CFCC601|nr:GNAT family protein [Microbulbifer aggregans]
MPEIVLEHLEHGHAQELYEIIEDNREYLVGWIQCVESINSAEDIRLFIEAELFRYTQLKPPYFTIKCDEEICGLIAFRSLDKNNKIGTISYWLSKAFTGKGIASQAVKKLITIGFEEFSLNKIQISCASNNLKSRAIPERLGFTYEATLRQCEWLNSTYVDHAIYTMLATEYYSAQNPLYSSRVPATSRSRLDPASTDNDT